MTIEERLEELLSLSEDERLELGERLLLSVPSFESNDAQRGWNDEIARRVREVESGEAETIPAETVFAEIREHLDGKSAETQL